MAKIKNSVESTVESTDKAVLNGLTVVQCRVLTFDENQQFQKEHGSFVQFPKREIVQLTKLGVFNKVGELCDTKGKVLIFCIKDVKCEKIVGGIVISGDLTSSIETPKKLNGIKILIPSIEFIDVIDNVKTLYCTINETQGKENRVYQNLNVVEYATDTHLYKV